MAKDESTKKEKFKEAGVSNVRDTYDTDYMVYPGHSKELEKLSNTKKNKK